MQHRIPIERYGELGPLMAGPITACVHCGFCLPACPTYAVLGEEMDSPRGRIYLMKSALEGVPEAWPAALRHVDRCLGCLSCVTACPSGVAYGQLLFAFRAAAPPSLSTPRRLLRRALLATLPYPRRFRVVLQAGRAIRPVARRLAPAAALPLWFQLVPDTPLPRPVPRPGIYPARGSRRARVALLVGCVQDGLAPEIHDATLWVLQQNGVEVVIPDGQGCCGALPMHAGGPGRRQALALARRNLKAFGPLDVDAVVTNAAGCGSAMKEYPLLFAGQPDAAKAAAFAAKVQDITEFLDHLGLVMPLAPLEGPDGRPLRVAYHDACHLAHGQRVHEAPRRLLRQIPGLDLVEIPHGEICCGSAGTYNLEHPRLAAELQRRKVDAIRSTRADLVVAGNIGCLVQIAAGLRRLVPQGPPVVHTIMLLERAGRLAAAASQTPAAGRGAGVVATGDRSAPP